MNGFRFATLLFTAAIVSPVFADVPPLGGGPNRESTQGELKSHDKKPSTSGASFANAPPPKPALPVRLTVVAPTPDPPWTMRIENTGDHPIRIAADIRLLSFDLERGDKGGTIKCAAPSGLRPSKFASDRELYLKPGEAYAEDFDPRLFCFGNAMDSLTGGTTVHAHYSFGPSFWGRPSLVAEGIDRPEVFAGLPQIDAPTILLSYRKVALPSNDPSADTKFDGNHPEKLLSASDGKPSEKDGYGKAHDGASAGDRAERSHKHCDKGTPKTERRVHEQPTGDTTEIGAKASDSSSYDWSAPCDDAKSADDGPPTFVDLNEPHVGIFVDRFADASAARDFFVTIMPEHDGRRDLLTLLRARMLSFSVEALGPDNQPTQTVDCEGSNRPHGVPAESLRDLGAGQARGIPLLVAEICPPGTFDRPGLYRVLPRMDSAVEGEGLTLHAYLGKALARQSTLVRIATGRDAFDEKAPKVASATPTPADGSMTPSPNNGSRALDH